MLIVCVAAFLSAGLTLFSGFGLGSLLLPVFAIFFPIETAVVATALVHLANNLFKGALLGRFANMGVVLRFGVPALLAAVVGAYLLDALAGAEPLTTWQLGSRTCAITPVGIVIGLLVVGFSAFELHPVSRSMGFEVRWMPAGGALSGFLGGLSGHQGAMRTAFLIRLGMSKEAFLGTGILCAILVDLARLSTYAALSGGPRFGEVAGQTSLVVGATVSAFAGSWVGRRLLPKVEMQSIHLLVGVLLAVLGLAIAVGIV
ncbi:MAG: TSUP family transporter [Candidatus Binatia bacterium]|nr:TSUP family transporter [Candidatus Binatia bacterium]